MVAIIILITFIAVIWIAKVVNSQEENQPKTQASDKFAEEIKNPSIPTFKENQAQTQPDNQLSYEKFIEFADFVGFNLNNPLPVESLAFFTIANLVLNPRKDCVFNRNELTLYDTIIFTLFAVRMWCIPKIANRTKAEEFSNAYIKKVFEYFPEGHKTSEKYDTDFFAERVKFYDSILTDSSIPFDERLKKLVENFEFIIAYDCAEKYVRFNEYTPLMLHGIEEHLIISVEVKTYFNKIPDVFAPLLQDILKFYD